MRLPPWKSYSVPEKCQACPYIEGLQLQAQNQALGAADIESSIGLLGLQLELRGRKRRAQHCQLGPQPLDSGLTYCATVDACVDQGGMIERARLNKEDRRVLEIFREMDEIDVDHFFEGPFPGEGPPFE